MLTGAAPSRSAIMIQPSDIKLFIGTPAFGGQISANYCLSLIRTVCHLNSLGIGHKIAIVAGDSLITRARNGIVAEMMADEKQFTHLLFIDADIGWEPESVSRLLRLDEDLAVGVYPKKCHPVEWTFRPEVREDGTLITHPSGFISAAEVPTGFMLIKRRVFELLMAAHPELHCHVSHRLKEEEKGFGYALFDCSIQDGRYLSEDYGFCRMWKELGGMIWLDPETDLTHTGFFTFSSPTKSCFILEDPMAEKKPEPESKSPPLDPKDERRTMDERLVTK